LEQPLVSVICTVYNQGKYIEKCLRSVLNQDYAHVEFIVIENGSSDGSKAFLEDFGKENKQVKPIFNPINKGLPKAFNQGFRSSTGSLIIDLSGDDILESEAITKMVDRFSDLESDYGIVFSNAMLIDENEKNLRRHFSSETKNIPQGDLFTILLSRYLICPPTMMFRRTVIDFMAGYDEELVYEDFDFWLRSSRNFKYAYLDQITIRKRIHPGSFSEQMTNPEFEESTLKVCEKALGLIKSRDEEKALQERLDYQIRQCILHKNRSLGRKYFGLRKKITSGMFSTLLIKMMWRFPGISRAVYLLLKSPFSTNPL
jgi:glycosyltransferase involved in cell wall biosynthesis